MSTTALNVNILVTARDEYTQQLKNFLGPLVYQGIESIYQEAEQTNPQAPIKTFQMFLRSVPKWNATTVEQETKRISKELTWIKELISAVLICNVRILISIRMQDGQKAIKLRLPELDKFIHIVYIKAARLFYYNPLCMVPSKNIKHVQAKRVECFQIIDEAIEDAIHHMLPVEEILREYLKNFFKKDPEPEESADSDQDQEEPAESDEEMEEEFDSDPESESGSEPEETESREPTSIISADGPPPDKAFDIPPERYNKPDPVPEATDFQPSEFPEMPETIDVKQIEESLPEKSVVPPPERPVPNVLDPPKPEPRPDPPAPQQAQTSAPELDHNPFEE